MTGFLGARLVTKLARVLSLAGSLVISILLMSKSISYSFRSQSCEMPDFVNDQEKDGRRLVFKIFQAHLPSLTVVFGRAVADVKRK